MQLKLEKEEVLEMIADAIEGKPCKLKLPEGFLIYGGRMATGGGAHVTFDLLTEAQIAELEGEAQGMDDNKPADVPLVEVPGPPLEVPGPPLGSGKSAKKG